MGVSELWSLLKAVGNVQHFLGSEGAHSTIVQEVEAKSVAVDLSAWIVQAICQPELAQAFGHPDHQALSVSFNRVCPSRKPTHIRQSSHLIRYICQLSFECCALGCKSPEVRLCACGNHRGKTTC